MKLLHTTDYTLYNPNIKKDFKTSIISDIHFSYTVPQEKLHNILKYLTSINPNYILIPGDLIDSVDMIEEEKERQRLFEWLKELGMLAPTLISIGGHDYYKKEINSKTNKSHWIYQYPEEFFSLANELKNIYILNNTSFEDDNLFITGYTQSMEYYHPKENVLATNSHTIPEDRELMLKELKSLKERLIHNLPQNKVKLAMIHSPVYLTNPEIKQELEEFDYFISGHMHNGCVPPILYELWNSTRGLIAPNKELFPTNERNTLKTNKDKLLVNGPITTFQECTGILQLANILYPTYTSTLNFTNDPFYNKEKLDIKRKYHKI